MKLAEAEAAEKKLRARVDAAQAAIGHERERAKARAAQVKAETVRALDYSLGAARYRLRELEREMSTDILHASDVVCATLVGCRSDDVAGVGYPLVVVDESTQATDAAVLTPRMLPAAAAATQLRLSPYCCCTPMLVLHEGVHVPPAAVRWHYEYLQLRWLPAAARQR